MRTRILPMLTMLAAVAVAPSCANRVETRLAFPPVADMKVDAEPEYPVAAFVGGEAGRKAEEEWWTATLLWGRAHRDRVQRICRWARELKAELPAGYCG